MGRWKKNPAQWHEQTMVYCELCGKIIPKNLWIAGESGQTLVFCGPDCEELHKTYWLPSRAERA